MTALAADHAAEDGLDGLDGLPAGLRRTLARLRAARPVEGADAAQALAQALAPVVASPWPEVAWSASLLMSAGFPVEVAWASRDTAVRWVCEVGGPEQPEAGRLAACVAMACALTGDAPDPAPWQRLQHGHRLRAGAWLGLRHRGAARAAKVYVELPAGSSLPAPVVGPARAAAQAVPGLRWVLAGANVDGTLELYFEAPVLTADAVAALGRLVDDGGRLGAGVRALAGRAALRPSYGSVLLAADGAPLAITWFALASTLWSTDELTTRRLTGLARTLPDLSLAPGSLSLYDALTAGADGRRRHGFVGFGVQTGGDTWLQAGLRPA